MSILCLVDGVNFLMWLKQGCSDIVSEYHMLADIGHQEQSFSYYYYVK